MIATDENRYVLSVAGQVVGFFGSGIPTTNNEDLQAGEEFPVTSGAVSYPTAPKLIFALKANLAWVGPSSDNNATGLWCPLLVVITLISPSS